MKQTFFILLFFLLTAAVYAESAGTVRLRLRWGGGESTAFGEVSCKSGQLSNLVPIAMDTECPGGAWLVNGKAVIAQSLPKKYNGFDFSIPWRPDGVLLIQLGTHSDGTDAQRIEIPLRDLVSGNKTFPFSKENATLQCSINRVPGDSLRVNLGKDNLVFSPRDLFQCTVYSNLIWSPVAPNPSGMTVNPGSVNSIPQENETGLLEYVIYRGRETFQVTHGTIPNFDLNGRSASQLQFQVPEEEGVYDIVLTVRRNQAGGNVIAERKIQFIVLNDSFDSNVSLENNPENSGKFQMKLEIDPSDSRWWNHFDKTMLRQFHSWFPNVESLQNPQRLIRTVGNQNFLEIPQSQNPAAAPNWEAFPLIVENPGTPYILEIEYLANVEQTFSVSILEPNSSGAITPPGIDSGVNVPPSLESSEMNTYRLDRHHILFWPQSKSPIVLLVNRHDKNPFCIGKLRLYDAGSHFLPMNSTIPMNADVPMNVGNGSVPRSPVQTRNASLQAFGTEKIKPRLMAALIDKPMFPQAFSSSEMNNSSTGLCVSDWLTFYEGGNRLIEYLEHVGFNALVLSVYADGSTIYPSRILVPTPRFENGMYFPTAQDPVRKDVVEMLLRQFDRRNLTLIPAMDFSSPISGLEVAARFPNAAELQGKMLQPGPIRWLNAEGKELCNEKATLKNGAPYYNILNGTVQETILRSIAEVVHRYGHHPAFGGISLQLHANSMLVLPGAEWGMDPESIAQFASETGKVLPPGFRNQVNYLTSETGLHEWLTWRAGKMTLFYRRAAAILSNIPDAKLYLNGTDLFALDSRLELLPRLDGIHTAQHTLLCFGLDAEQLKLVPNLVLSRPQKILTNHPINDQAGDLQWMQTPGTYRIFQEQKSPAAVFYHAPEVLRLEAFDHVSPFNPTFTWMATTYAQTTAEARRPYAETLAMLDAFTMIEGGWNPVFGKEEALRGTIRILSQLPAVHFNSAMNSGIQGPKSQPVIFRNCSLPGVNYMYAVNITPFQMTARVYIQPSLNQQTQNNNQLPARLVRLENGTYTALQRDEQGKFFWKVQLAPYQIEAVRFMGEPVILLDPVCEIPPEIQLVFQQEFLKLQYHIASLKQPTFYLGLKNPGFESLAQGKEELPYWKISFPNPEPQIIPVSAQEMEGRNHFQSLNILPTVSGGEASVTLEPARDMRFGENSLYMQSQGKPIQIMSQPFTVNPTGRLTVLVWLRAKEEGTKLPLKLILEGNTKNGSFQRTTNFATSGTLIGKEWKQVTIQFNDLPLEKETLLSLGFELYGSGNVWIDNIQLSDVHFSDSEIQQLSSIFAQFENHITRNEIAPCVSTLECYWLRFLKENVAVNTPPQSSPLVQNGDEKRKSYSDVEYVPEKTGLQLPHLGQLPNLPKLPAPPKLPNFKSTPKEENEFEEEKKKNTYMEKMKNWLPW